MATTENLLDAVRSHCLAQGIARPAYQAVANLPPLYLQPEDGAPAPGDKTGVEANADLVLSAFHSGGIAAQPYEEFLRKDIIEFWLRARKVPYATERERLLRAAFLGEMGKRDWLVGTGPQQLHVHSTQEWRPFQPARGFAGHSFTVALLFEYAAI